MPSRGCHSLNAYQGLGALGWAVHTRCKSVTSSLQSYETGAIILPIVQMRPLRHREMKFAQGPVGCGWQSWVLNPTSLTSAPRLFRPLVNDQGAGLRALGPWAHLCCMRWGTSQGVGTSWERGWSPPPPEEVRQRTAVCTEGSPLSIVPPTTHTLGWGDREKGGRLEEATSELGPESGRSLGGQRKRHPGVWNSEGKGQTSARGRRRVWGVTGALLGTMWSGRSVGASDSPIKSFKVSVCFPRAAWRKRPRGRGTRGKEAQVRLVHGERW